MPFVSVPARAIDINYADQGVGDPVVLIGGLSSTIDTFGRQIGPLSQRYRVIAPDNRGSGRTRVLDDDGVRSPQQWAGDILALIDGLDLDRVHLVGVSMGGYIVQAFAVEHPDRLRSLALLCTTPGGEHTVAIPPEMLRGIVAGALAGASDDDYDAYATAALHPETRQHNPVAWEFLLSTRVGPAHSPEELAARQAGIGGFSVWEQLAELTVPTLVMTGEGDQLVPPENSTRLAERIPGAELRFVDRGGHLFFMEQPETVNTVLADFFARH